MLYHLRERQEILLGEFTSCDAVTLIDFAVRVA
jgi:hypothetical protein